LLSGGRYEGQGLEVGYFAQHQLEVLRPAESALWHLRRLDPEAREQELRDFLGGFDFRGERVHEPIAPFSGGEKARLALALIIWQKPNLLLLDEPTNHLDIEMREALAEALQDFEGTLVVVAHDRHLLKATTDTFWLVADGRLQAFDGDLDDYKQWARDHAAARGKAGKPQAGRAVPGENGPEGAPVLEFADRKEQKRAEAAARQRDYARKKPLEDKLARLEGAMKALSHELRDIETWLSMETAYTDENKALLTDRLRRQGEIQAALADAEWKWFEVQEKIDALQGPA
jgi:ATP-binding cassette subfamily F protein 3